MKKLIAGLTLLLSASFIPLSPANAVEYPLQCFQGWIDTVPAGGTNSVPSVQQFTNEPYWLSFSDKAYIAIRGWDNAVWVQDINVHNSGLAYDPTFSGAWTSLGGVTDSGSQARIYRRWDSGFGAYAPAIRVLGGGNSYEIRYSTNGWGIYALGVGPSAYNAIALNQAVELDPQFFFSEYLEVGFRLTGGGITTYRCS